MERARGSFSYNGWLAAVPLCVGLAGRLLGGMDSKPVFCVRFVFNISILFHFR